jgi:hypothetical protein
MGDNEFNPKDIEQNPFGKELQIEVSIPQKFEVKMVDASSLGDYELWVFIASLLCNCSVGFVIAGISNTIEDRVPLYISINIMLFVFFALSLIIVYKKRKKMTIEKKIIKMGLSNSKD